MGRDKFPVVVVLLLSSSPVLAEGDGSLQAPLTIPAGRPGPVTVNWGDFNGDGKLDLVVANGVSSNEASGSPSILVLFQNPSQRLDWKPLSLRVGSSGVYVRGADMDRDGSDDILVADVARSAFYVHSRGDGTFDPPVAIPGASGARWIAVADFDNDGHLDFASSNFRASNLTVFLGDGTGKFTLHETYPGRREHTLETMDFDGDGNMDLMQGIGLPGITPFLGQGDGTFQPLSNISNLGCIEYISEVGHYDRDGSYVLIGDFNLDGAGDLAVTCIDDGTAYGGYSLGDGSYRRTFQAAAGGGTESTAIADLNQDGLPDIALVSAQSTNLWVYPGEGDGTFMRPETFGPTGANPVFLISQDLDRDGFFDVVSADNGSFSVTVFWGKDGEKFLESGHSLTGFSAAKAMAVADLDRDGLPDLLFPRSDQPLVNVYRKPGLDALTKPSYSIATDAKYSLLEVADLDRDGILDLAGADLAGGRALVALLDAAGKARSQQALAAGISPSAVELGQLDGGGPLDMAVPCKGSNHVALFFGQGGGAFAEARILPTVEKPKGAALGMLDGDAVEDLAVIADTAVAAHYGKGGGDFTGPIELVKDPSKVYTDVAMADLNRDSIVDLAVSESKTQSVLLFYGKGNRQFELPAAIKTGAAPGTLVLADLNGDGRPDLTNSATRSVSIILSRGEKEFAAAVSYGVGVAPVGHRIVDLNRDGALDVVAFSSTSATVLLGRTDPASVDHFRRGDVNADGLTALDDPLLVIFSLFGGGAPLPCEDAADADDSGTLELGDPILFLNWLFLEGEDFPPPGPGVCGRDPSGDALKCAAICP